jgi:hypothetical protein
MFTIVQFVAEFVSFFYVDEAAHLLFYNIVPYSFQIVSEYLEQIAADPARYYTFRIVMSPKANRVKCEQSEKLEC